MKTFQLKQFIYFMRLYIYLQFRTDEDTTIRYDDDFKLNELKSSTKQMATSPPVNRITFIKKGKRDAI